MVCLLTIPYLGNDRELHLLPRGVDGSLANLSEEALWRGCADTVVTSGLHLPTRLDPNLLDSSHFL